MKPHTKEPDHGSGLAAGTVRMVRENLAALFNYALRNKLIDSSPVSDSIPPRKTPSCGNPLTVEEALAFVSVSDRTWYGNAFTFNLQTGLRPSELMGLIWDDIDPVGKTLRIERACKWLQDGRSIIGDVKTRRSKRMIELSDEHILFLEEHREKLRRQMEERNKAGKGWGEPEVSEWVIRKRPRLSHRYQDRELVFPSRAGQIPYLHSARWAFKFLLRAAGLTGNRLKLRWYDLRHTHATILLTLGVPRHEVAERLGHTVEMLDSVYSHTLPGRQRKASSLFLSLIPTKVTSPMSGEEYLNAIKQTAASCREDVNSSLIKLIGYPLCER